MIQPKTQSNDLQLTQFNSLHIQYCQNPILDGLRLAVAEVKIECDLKKTRLERFYVNWRREKEEITDHLDIVGLHEERETFEALSKRVRLLHGAIAHHYPTSPGSWANYRKDCLVDHQLEDMKFLHLFALPDRNLSSLFRTPFAGDPILDCLIRESQEELQLYLLWLRKLNNGIQEADYI